MKRKSILSATAVLLGMIAAGSASAFSIRIVGDNDFAIFGGTATGINTLLYQNNMIWMDQIPALTTLTFTLPATDTTFYVLGMGGGGEENISGLVNGVDMTDIPVSMSSAMQSFLTGYNTSTVTSGTYNVLLSDVQTAFSQLTWGAPVLDTDDTVIAAAAPNKKGFHFDNATAHLFRFDASDVGVGGGGTTVPEPGSLALLGLGLAGLAVSRRRKPR